MTRRLIAGLATLGLGAAQAAAEPVAIAALGDSLSTGAVTHPALAFDGHVLWDIFSGAVSVAPKRTDLPAAYQALLPDPLPQPQRLWPSSREFFGGPDWIWRSTMQSIARSYLDTAAYSWGYLLAARLEVPASGLALAGEDGARISQLPRHLDRLLATTGGVLPKRLVLFYTGNDLCGTSLADVTTEADYAKDLELGLDYLLRSGQPAPGGTDVYLAAQMNILQLLTAESILAKKVRAFGGEATCGELRARGFKPTAEQAEALRVKPIGGDQAQSPLAWYFSLVMPPSPAGFCTTLFSPMNSKADEDQLHALANRLRSFRERQVQLIDKFKVGSKTEGGPQQIRLHYLPGTAALKFVGDDIAQDCFHLSIAGQAKVAEAMLSGVQAAEAVKP